MRVRRCHPLFTALVISSSTLLSSVSAAQAQTPYGWISNDHISAYVLQPGSFELSGNILKVDDDIDFLDMRDDLLAGNSRLAGKSGDLAGSRGELRVGVWRGLELFYSRQNQELTLELGPVSSADITELDDKLDTTSIRYGAKWVFYESARKNLNNPWRSAALELTRTENDSRSFGGLLQSVRFNANTAITFDPPQRFALDQLSDEGWQARLIYSQSLTAATGVSVWAGYGSMESSSGTSTEIDFATIANAFKQTFNTEETLWKAGASVNWQRFERLPVQLGYEYISIRDRQQDIVSSNSTLLPSFLRGSNLNNSETSNHTAYATVSFWITPQLYVGASGKLFKHQFVGIMPHYNNPLSGGFSDTLYGYAEFRAGLKFDLK